MEILRHGNNSNKKKKKKRKGLVSFHNYWNKQVHLARYYSVIIIRVSEWVNLRWRKRKQIMVRVWSLSLSLSLSIRIATMITTKCLDYYCEEWMDGKFPPPVSALVHHSLLRLKNAKKCRVKQFEFLRELHLSSSVNLHPQSQFDSVFVFLPHCWDPEEE